MVLLLLNKETDLVVVEVVPVLLLLDLMLREVLLVIRLVVQDSLSGNSLDLEYILICHLLSNQL
tara:strand:+ start:346 stop:537 length:192 start_codon:yes stop_codon:yes gene_type:complete